MKFSIERDVFLEGVQQTLGIVDKRSSIPILSNVLIEAAENRIRIVATDREIGIRSDFSANVESEGRVTVSARKLFEMIREIGSGDVIFQKMDNNWVHLSCGKVNYRIPSMSAEDFPEIAIDDELSYFAMSAPVIREMVTRTIFAVSSDEMRPTINGIFFSVEGGSVKMVATDGHRLALMENKADVEDVLGVIIPRKGIGEIRKLIDGNDGPVEISLIGGRCYVKVGGTLLRVNLIDGDYPDFKRVIPSGGGVEVVVDRKKLLHSLRRMSIMVSDRFSGVKIELANDKMVLSSTNPDVGEARDEIDVSYDGEGFVVGYSVRYLLDAIEAMTEDSVSLEMRTNEGASVIRPVGNESCLCIVMPLKLRDE